ncbi:MAG: hypothetical protein ACXWUG_28360, partial [Polyangiales bacterium]
MRSLITLGFVFALAACGPSQTTKPVESPAPAASSAAPVAAPAKGLVIKEAKFTGGTPPMTITLREDGRIEGPDGKTKATLSADGKLTGATSGKVIATIDPNGKVTFADGNEATSDEDGTILVGADSVKLGADGVLEGDKSGTKIMV